MRWHYTLLTLKHYFSSTTIKETSQSKESAISNIVPTDFQSFGNELEAVLHQIPFNSASVIRKESR